MICITSLGNLTGFGRAYGSRGAFSQTCKELADVLSQSSWYLLSKMLLQQLSRLCQVNWHSLIANVLMSQNAYPTRIVGNGSTKRVGLRREWFICSSDSELQTSWFDLLWLVSSSLVPSVVFDNIQSLKTLQKFIIKSQYVKCTFEVR